MDKKQRAGTNLKVGGAKIIESAMAIVCIRWGYAFSSLISALISMTVRVPRCSSPSDMTFGITTISEINEVPHTFVYPIITGAPQTHSLQRGYVGFKNLIT